MFKLNERITWVGKIDWELKKFHGEEYSTHRGSSYNSYLIQDEKVALIDTVWQPFDEEFVKNLKKVIDLKKIDYIIANLAVRHIATRIHELCNNSLHGILLDFRHGVDDLANSHLFLWLRGRVGMGKIFLGIVNNGVERVLLNFIH